MYCPYFTCVDTAAASSADVYISFYFILFFLIKDAFQGPSKIPKYDDHKTLLQERNIKPEEFT